MSIEVVGEVRENGRVELYNAVETVNLAELSGIHDGPHVAAVNCPFCGQESNGRPAVNADGTSYLPCLGCGANLSEKNAESDPAKPSCTVCNDTGYLVLFNGPKPSPRVECHCCQKGLDVMLARVAADNKPLEADSEEPESVGDRLARIARDLERIKGEISEVWSRAGNSCGYLETSMECVSLAQEGLNDFAKLS